jgi:hypothetical protein
MSTTTTRCPGPGLAAGYQRCLSLARGARLDQVVPTPCSAASMPERRGGAAQPTSPYSIALSYSMTSAIARIIDWHCSIRPMPLGAPRDRVPVWKAALRIGSLRPRLAPRLLKRATRNRTGNACLGRRCAGPSGATPDGRRPDAYWAVRKSGLLTFCPRASPQLEPLGEERPIAPQEVRHVAGVARHQHGQRGVRRPGTAGR